jgi:hypothetical protein
MITPKNNERVIIGKMWVLGFETNWALHNEKASD